MHQPNLSMQKSKGLEQLYTELEALNFSFSDWLKFMRKF
jgi:hypothetical protein